MAVDEADGSVYVARVLVGGPAKEQGVSCLDVCLHVCKRGRHHQIFNTFIHDNSAHKRQLLMSAQEKA